MILFLGEISSKPRKLPRHKLNLRTVNEVHHRVEAVVINNSTILGEVDQEAADKGKGEDSLPPEGQVISLAQDGGAEEPRQHKIEMCGFILYSIYGKKACSLLAFSCFPKRDVKKMPIPSQTRTSVQQPKRVLST